MAKEVTLEELARSSNNKNAKPAARAEAVPKTPVVESGIKSARTINTADLGKNLQAQNPDAKPKIVEEDAPLVANAFKAMDDTLAEKKRFIEEEMMPIVMENAREIAMENELGENAEEDSFEEDPATEVTEASHKKFDLEDDFAELDEEETVEDSYDDEPEVVINMDNASESKVVNKPEPVVVDEKPEETKEDTSASLEDMMKDLELDYDSDEDDDEIDLETETTEELRERFKTSLSKVKITRDPIDLSKFQIAKKPESAAMALHTIGTNNTKKRCDHPLLHSNRNMTFEECSGPELDSLRKTINNSTGLNGVIASLRFVYNHNIDANKKSFEAWCKSIRTEDIESLYFGMYKACYGDTNLVARTDPKNDSKKTGCGKTSLIDTPILDMIKYKDDDAKKLYNDLMYQDTTTSGDKVNSQAMVVSDDIVITYTDPTLYSTFIQYATLKPEISEKYADHLNTMAYINGFYRINRNDNTLIPIAIKEYPNSINKTIMSKLKTYIDILKTLSTDQYNVMVSKLDNVIGEPKISYIYPEAVCPECGNTISEEPVDSMLSLLFTRAQLVQVKSL